MNGLDAICLALISICVLRGLFRGVWMELADLTCALASFTGAVLSARTVSSWLSTKVPIPTAVSIAICFFVLYFVYLNTLRLVIHWFRARGRIAFLLRLWGAVVGFVRGILYAGIFAFLALQFTSFDKLHWRKSNALLVKPFAAVAVSVYRFTVKAVPETEAVFAQINESIRVWAKKDSFIPPI